MAVDPDDAHGRIAERVVSGGVDRPPSAEDFLLRLGHRYAAGGRAGVGVLMAVVAPFASPPAGPVLGTVVGVLLMAWSLVYLRLMWGEPRHPYWVLEVVLVCALCFAQPALVDPERLVAFQGWVSPVASFAVVALQWHLRLLPAVGGTLVITAAYVLGAAASPEVSLVQAVWGGGAWMLVEAALSRLLARIVRRACRAASAVMEMRFAEERREALAVARRADQRAHWAAVHDTSASTLLMIGLGEVRGDELWLPGQIERDLEVLDGDTAAGRETALADALTLVVARSPLTVDLHEAGLPDRVPVHVVAALAGAVGEALENVRRHAGVLAATVHAVADGDRVRIVVEDSGCGFDPAAVGPGHDGLALSVHDRLTRAGGRAAVDSTPGSGTRVLLEWPA